jgi:glycosyltransferase involved in cell wall biosynthesis
MPAYNSEDYIEASILSVINQTYKNWELIVVDDGSTDNTAAIVKSMQVKYNKIIYLHQANGRQAKARNYGIEKSSGALLAFLDSDDLWLPEKLEKSISLFDYNSYDLLFTESYATSDTLINLEEIHYQKMGVRAGQYSGNLALKQFIECNRIPILTVLVKKEKVIEVGGFDENCVPAEDYDLWIRLLKKGSEFIASNEALSIYRLQQNSSTASDRLATAAVLKCFYKNFSIADINRLKAKKYIRIWVKRWISIHFLTQDNKNEVIQTLKYFELFNVQIRSILLLRKLYSFKELKSKIMNAV